MKKSDSADLNAAYQEAEINTLAILGFSSGVLAYLLIFIPIVNLLLVPAAIIFSSIALKQIENSGGKENGRKLAKAGLILGIVAVVLSILTVIAFIIGIGVGF